MAIKNIKLLKKALNITAITGVSIGAVTGLGFAIKSWTENNTLSAFEGANTIHQNQLLKDETSNRNKLIMEYATVDFGLFGSLQFDTKKWNELVIAGASKDAERKQMGVDFQKEFIKMRRQTHYNPTLVIKVTDFKLTNDYLDMFDFNDSVDYVDFILNDVSFGPDILTLDEFSIVRGRNQLGRNLVLGAHSGNRENTKIAFYPDSFFGIQSIYNGGRSSVFSNTEHMDYKGNDLIRRTFIQYFNKHIVTPELLNKINNPTITNETKELEVNGQNVTTGKLYDYEVDDQYANSFLSKKVFDDYLMNLSGRTLKKLSEGPLLKLPQSQLNKKMLPGNFDSLIEFVNFIHDHDSIPAVAVSKDVTGKEKIVYPRRFFNRVLTTVFMKKDMSKNVVEILSKNDIKRRENQIANKDSEDGITNETNLFTLNDMNDLTTENVGLWDAFDAFNGELSNNMVLPIAKIIELGLGIKPIKTIKSTTYDSFGNLKTSLLYKSFMGVVETMKKYKDEFGWSPVNFDSQGIPNLNEFIPNTYLYTYMDRTEGLKEVLADADIHSNTKQINDDDALSRKKVAHLGIEWLKYTTSHEYGHHQTLFYSKDVSQTLDESNMEAPGIYNTDEQVYSGSSNGPHGYNQAYSRQYINEMLRARTGGGDLRDFSLPLGDSQQIHANTAQIAIDAIKQKMKFVMTDASGQDRLAAIGENFATAFDDFANSWRGYKTYDQLLNAVFTHADLASWVAAHPGEPSTLPYSIFLMNALDESSFSLNPTIATPSGAFGDLNTQVATDPELTAHAESINFGRKVNGWDSHIMGGSEIKIGKDFMALATYKTTYLNAAGQEVTDTNNKPREAMTRIPKSLAATYMSSTFDLETLTSGVIEDDAIVMNTNINNDNSFSVGTSMYTGKLKWANLFDAKSMYLSLYKDKTTMKFTTSTANAVEEFGRPKKFAQKVSSMHFKQAGFAGFRQLPIIEALYGRDGGDLLTTAKADRKAKLIEDIVKEINKDKGAEIVADEPIANIVDSKDAFRKWMSKGVGLKEETQERSNEFLEVYAKNLFNQYWTKVGRFIEYSEAENAYHPTMESVLFIGQNQSADQQLNAVYSSYLSTGAYALYQNISSDYEMTLPEVLTRDLQEIAYAPSRKALPGSGGKTEYADSVSLELAPIFVRTLTKDGPVSPLPGMTQGRGYDTKTYKMINKSSVSGFWKDYALRRETHSTLYITPKAAKANGESFQKLSMTGKAYINFLRDTEGIRSDTDVSGIHLDKRTGFAQMFGYMDKDDAKRFNYIAFQSPDGEVKYLPISQGHSNQFFYEKFGQVNTRKSLLDHCFDTDGNMVDLSTASHALPNEHAQVAWASDKMLATGFSNTFLETGVKYKAFFTENASLTLPTSKEINLGSRLSTYKNADTGTFHVTRTWKHKLFNNGFDEYSGTIKMTQSNIDESTYIEVRRTR